MEVNYEPPGFLGYFTHAQTVCTRPFLFPFCLKGPGDEANQAGIEIMRVGTLCHRIIVAQFRLKEQWVLHKHWRELSGDRLSLKL